MVSPKKTPKNPIVSVCVQTYQHASYIREALDSILMQQTEFDFEIVLGEDESTDGTREMCIEYAKRYNEKIRLFLNSRKNVIYINGHPTGRWNILNNLKNARGKYIALLPGDDYWTDSNKIQRQVEYLKKNTDCAICFHPVQWLNQEKHMILPRLYGPEKIRTRFSLDDLLEQGNFIPTCSVLYRNYYPKKFPDWFYRIPVGDFPLHIINAMNGKIGYINETMAVYRQHSSGIYSGNKLSKQLEISLKTYAYIGKYLNLSNRNSFITGKFTLQTKLALAKFQEGKIIKAIIICFSALRKSSKEKLLKNSFLILRLFFPNILKKIDRIYAKNSQC